LRLEKKTTQVNLRLTPALKAAAEKAAGEERRSFTSLVENLLTAYLQTQPSVDDWHERGRARFLRLVAEHQAAASIATGAQAKSFCIKAAPGERIEAHHLLRELQFIHGHSSAAFRHVPFFHPYTRRGLVPYFASDSELTRGRAEEILECFAAPPLVEGLEFWRVAPSGLAFDMRPYAEDREAFRQHGLEPGKWFSPYFMTRDLEVFVHFAAALAAKIAPAAAVEFRCEWHGLMNRYAAAGEPDKFWPPAKFCRTDHRITRGEWPAAELSASWAEIVSALGGPVVRLFDPTFAYAPEWIRSQSVKGTL